MANNEKRITKHGEEIDSLKEEVSNIRHEFLFEIKEFKKYHENWETIK